MYANVISEQKEIVTAKLLFVYCNGPHDGPCPNRVMRLLTEMAKQFSLFLGGSGAGASRQIVEQGRRGEDLRYEAVAGQACSWSSFTVGCAFR
jgi:hypothetical protein